MKEKKSNLKLHSVIFGEMACIGSHLLSSVRKRSGRCFEKVRIADKGAWKRRLSKHMNKCCRDPVILSAEKRCEQRSEPHNGKESVAMVSVCPICMIVGFFSLLIFRFFSFFWDLNCCHRRKEMGYLSD